MYEDKTLVCIDCGAEFVFTAEEQAFYEEKGFPDEPRRCKPCREARKPNSIRHYYFNNRVKEQLNTLFGEQADRDR